MRLSSIWLLLHYLLPPMSVLKLVGTVFDVETIGEFVPITTVLLVQLLPLLLLLLPLVGCEKNRWRSTAAFDIGFELKFVSETTLGPAGIVSFGFNWLDVDVDVSNSDVTGTLFSADFVIGADDGTAADDEDDDDEDGNADDDDDGISDDVGTIFVHSSLIFNSSFSDISDRLFEEFNVGIRCVKVDRFWIDDRLVVSGSSLYKLFASFK